MRDDLQDRLRSWFPLGFPRSRHTAEAYDMLGLEAGGDENVDRLDFTPLRLLTERINSDLAPSQTHGEIMEPDLVIALSLVTDAMRYLLEHYCHREHPEILARGLDRARTRLDPDTVQRIPTAFVPLFPPVDVLRGDESVDGFLKASRAAVPNADSVITEMILLFLLHRNPATRTCRKLFDDAELRKRVSYVPLVVCLEEFFDSEPPTDLSGMTLFHTLRAPMRACPDDLIGQLAYIRQHWAALLPDHLLRLLDLAADVLKEHTTARGLGPGSSPVLDFKHDRDGSAYPEPAAFSRDADWMSNVVLIAKSVYVWLDQLSRWYGRPVNRLDEVPDEELDRLARWGFSGLWLIGLWQRAPASRNLKRYLGNPTAEASAYSLHDYRIAADLGGDEAWQDLSHRAGARGIRLASDMVPNHMGLDSAWMAEHPDWFIGGDQPPFPWYSFDGGNLSDDDRMNVYIEDGYWHRSDAAVVFKRVDNKTGAVRYIYHGNDGTSMPWNDTAQLDYMQAQVRESVIQVILEVARRFPIIRFDAAMTLTKKHYQRLWFPMPGDGGAIPSRAEHGLTKEQFDAAFPAEFWREVVDRVAAEVPDTLLLAEAFWLMEGYFVRTLGMHRVYNSAFMNMLKMEENGKYLQTIRNVLEFSPEVLKRFVNFMNNPDERTAVEQFGKGDKYFGVAVLMATMPGLPMFGHGQIEGFAEKYGMEYRRACWEEPVDEDMIRRHEAEIFPLLHRRHIFSGAENFALYDFARPDGSTDDNVFAYTNNCGADRALVLYNNSYESTRGSLLRSGPANVGDADNPDLRTRTLAEALDIQDSATRCYSWREHRTGLQYIRTGQAFHAEGYSASLKGYEYQILLDFRAWDDTDDEIMKLCHELDGRGVPDLDLALREMRLEPILQPFAGIFEAPLLEKLGRDEVDATDLLSTRIDTFLEAVMQHVGRGAIELTPPLQPSWKQWKDDDLLHVLLAWLVLDRLAEVLPRDTTTTAAATDWLLAEQLVGHFRNLGLDFEAARDDVRLVLLLDQAADLLRVDSNEDFVSATAELLAGDPARSYLHVNEYEEELWLNRENLNRLTAALETTGGLCHPAEADEEDADASPEVENDIIRLRGKLLRQAAESAGYRLGKLLRTLSESCQDETG